MIRSVWIAVSALVLISAAIVKPGEDEAQIDEANTVAMIKANYLFNFAKYSDWPDNYKKGQFRIGIYGDEYVFEELLEKYATKSIGSQMLEVVKYEGTSEIKKPHILFISRDKKNDFSKIKTRLSTTSTMIVADIDGALSMGATINFIVREGNIRFEINEKDAQERKFILGDKIKNWAIK